MEEKERIEEKRRSSKIYLAFCLDKVISSGSSRIRLAGLRVELGPPARLRLRLRGNPNRQGGPKERNSGERHGDGGSRLMTAASGGDRSANASGSVAKSWWELRVPAPWVDQHCVTRA